MTSMNPSDLRSATDAELIELSRQGNHLAYGQIVQRYQTLVCSVGYSRCGDLAVSEDLAQDGFVLAWKNLADLKDGSKFKAWVCTIVRNLASRASQQSSRSVSHAAEHLDVAGNVPADSESPLERVVSAEEEQMVWQALADIPESYREVLVLFYREEQSVTDVADALNLSADAVKQRLSRGRRLLRQQLAAVVESTLVRSKPAKVFTGAVLLKLFGAADASAAGVTLAGGTTVAGTTAAGTAVANSAGGVGATAGLSSLLIWPLMKLPLVAWLLRSAFGDTRSERERQLLRRFLALGLCGFAVFVGVLVSSFWWQHHIEPPLLRACLPAALMGVFLIPWIICSRRYGKRVERLRMEEGTFTEPMPLFPCDGHGPVALKVYRRFGFSSLLVAAGPAVLMLVADDWLALAAMLASAVSIGLAAAWLNIRRPRWSFQLYGVAIPLTALVTLGIMFGRQSVWGAEMVDITTWMMGASSAATVSSTVLTTIAWKRVYGRPSARD